MYEHLIPTLNAASSLPEAAHIITEWLKHLQPFGISPTVASTIELGSTALLIWLSIVLGWKAVPHVASGIAGIGRGIGTFHSGVSGLISKLISLVKKVICQALRWAAARLERKS